MTIDVADLRKRAERTFPQVYPSELTELLDAYEEREWLTDPAYRCEIGCARFANGAACRCSELANELPAMTAERDRLRGDVQTTINEWGHASHCELYVSQNDIPSACDCIIADLKRALEGRE